MAERVQAKAKKSVAGKPGVRPTGSRAGPAFARDQVTELEAECQRLKAELALTAQRVEALEAQRKQLLDRIDWAIDSLHSLVGK